MIWALFRKELRQHGGLMLLLVLVTSGATQVVQIAMSINGMAGSAFFGLGIALMTIVPLACLILGHRLVVVEFRDKTQLFLEALPISRMKLIGVKYGLGLFCALGCGLAALALTWWQADVGEGRTERFLEILVARTGLWVVFVYTFFFMMGFLGRYRVAVFIVLYFAVVMAAEGGQIPVGEFPPFMLVDLQTFGFERDDFPISDLGWTGGIAVVLAGASFGLGLVREGSVASMMGEKMSHKEKMLVGGLIAGAVSGAMTLSMKHPEPFVLPDAVTESQDGVEVSVASPLERKVDREVALAAKLVGEMVEAKRRVGARAWPEIYVVEREDDFEEGAFFRLGELEEEGVLVYADYRDEAFPEDEFVRFVLDACLVELSGGRVKREGKKWLYLGFVEMWGGRDLPAEEAREAVEAEGLDEHDVSRWLSYEKAVGEEEAKAVAWAGVKLLGERYGDVKMRAVLAAVLGRSVEQDVRATIYDLRNPVPEVFERVTGDRFADFVRAWRESISGEEGGGA
ncbi:MAG: hypothetical protein P8J87_16750 [Verrucomicrobiales bacterium]|nr:hypothetical protein [Verrucomicrobiales bacterium]